jgi:hypothetical protein
MELHKASGMERDMELHKASGTELGMELHKASGTEPGMALHKASGMEPGKKRVHNKTIHCIFSCEFGLLNNRCCCFVHSNRICLVDNNPSRLQNQARKRAKPKLMVKSNVALGESPNS